MDPYFSVCGVSMSEGGEKALWTVVWDSLRGRSGRALSFVVDCPCRCAFLCFRRLAMRDSWQDMQKIPWEVLA